MSGRSNAAKKIYAAILKLHGAKRSAKSAFDFYYEPLDEKSILISGLGLGVRGNMQYILDELNHNDKFSDFRIYVRTKKDVTDKVVAEYIERRGWDRTETVYDSDARVMETCKYLITEDFFPYSWIKRPGQVVINTWHGVPLKKMGLSKNGNRKHINSKQQKNFLSSDFLTYPNGFTRDIMLGSYGVSRLLKAKIIMMGYPRTAGMLALSDKEAEDLRRSLAPGGEHIYAYMPTFRGDLSDEEAVAREKGILDVLDAGLGDDQLLYVNLHHHINEGIDVSGYRHIKLFPPLVDSYSLLRASEALVTDYSSVFFDYLVTRKHIILHVDDLEDYSSKRGLNLDIRSLPFDTADDAALIPQMLRDGKQYDDSEIYSELCAHDDPDNIARLCALILGEEDGLSLQRPPQDNRKKVLIYSEGCFAGRDTERLREMAKLNESEPDGLDIYIGCCAKQVKNDPSGAYPLLNEVPVIATALPGKLSSMGTPILDLYNKGKISFRAAMGYLKEDYALYTRRMFGDAAFDCVVIYDTLDPGTIIGLSLGDAPRKALYISSRMGDALSSGSRTLADAVGFAAARCDIVSVADAETEKLVRPLLRKADRSKIITEDSAEEALGRIRQWI